MTTTRLTAAQAFAILHAHQHGERNGDTVGRGTVAALGLALEKSGSGCLSGSVHGPVSRQFEIPSEQDIVFNDCLHPGSSNSNHCDRGHEVAKPVRSCAPIEVQP